MRRLVLVAALIAAVVPATARSEGSLSFRASVTPRTHLFGDPVVAEVQAVAPTVDAIRMQVKTDFAPYVVVGPVEIERVSAGARTEVRWRWHLDCLTRACLPGETQRRVVFGPARITLPSADGPVEIATATWPVVIVRSRLGPDVPDRARHAAAAALGGRCRRRPCRVGRPASLCTPHPAPAARLRTARLGGTSGRPHPSGGEP